MQGGVGFGRCPLLLFEDPVLCRTFFEATQFYSKDQSGWGG